MINSERAGPGVYSFRTGSDVSRLLCPTDELNRLSVFSRKKTPEKLELSARAEEKDDAKQKTRSVYINQRMC